MSTSVLSADLLPLTAALERIEDGVLALDAYWHITFVNDTAAEVFGRTRESLYGRHVWEEFPEGVGTEFEQAYTEAFRTQTPGRFELFSNFHRQWFEVNIHPAPSGLSVLFREITAQRETRRQLAQSEQRYRSLFEQNVDAVFTLNTNGRFTEANAACEALVGYTPAELRGMFYLPLADPEFREKTLALTSHVLAGKAGREEITLLHKSGRRVQVDLSKTPILIDGAVVGIHGIAKDITEQRAAEQALRDSESLMRMLAEASPVATTITRWEDSQILYANRHVSSLFGLDAAETLTNWQTRDFYVRPEDRQRLLRALSKTALIQNQQFELRGEDGRTFWVHGSFQRMSYRGEDAIFSVYHDVSEGRRQLDEAREEAERDPLTGLLNHRAFHARLEAAARQVEADTQAGTTLAVAVLDLDNFKFFNDAYGHPVGDDVLRQVANALRRVCRTDDVLARFGGDEFALLMLRARPGATSEALAFRLEADLAALGIAHRPEGSDGLIPISVSAGVALFPDEASTRLEAIHLADERLLRAKTGAERDGPAPVLRRALRESIAGFPMLDALLAAVNNKDRYTRHHSEDVLTHSLTIARALGLDAQTQHDIEVAALLHDVGKIGVPDHILRKPGRLTGDEFEAICQHPYMGVVIVSAVPGLEATLDAVHRHHERWDGGGYPDGLAGEAIPLTARILAVADAYSAMTTDRPYRKGMDPAQAHQILQDGAGTQWDPACVAAFLAAG